MTETTADVARQIATLTARKRAIKEALKTVQDALNETEERMIAALVEEGIAKISVDAGEDGTWTISASTLAWAKLKDGTQSVALPILKANDMMELLTINSTKLSGLYREHVAMLEHGGEILPKEFVELIEVSERTKVSARKV